jgi:hypothetical protein
MKIIFLSQLIDNEIITLKKGAVYKVAGLPSGNLSYL